MGEEVGSDEGFCDVGHRKQPREIPAYSQVKAEGQSSIGGDDIEVIRADVVAYTLLALWDQLEEEHAEVRARVY
jgi:hypothetical protein